MAIRPDILAYQTTNECAPYAFSFRLVGNPVENHRGVQPHCFGVALSAVGGFMVLMTL